MSEWWEERSLGEKIVLGILFGILGIGLVFLFGWILMLLWNWLMPDIFGLKRIGYWQAWGLLLLSCILFGRVGGSSSSSSGKSDRRRKKELRRYVRESGESGEGGTEAADSPLGKESANA
jgi:hypothetical protein